jgi:hypothetical protein
MATEDPYKQDGSAACPTNKKNSSEHALLVGRIIAAGSRGDHQCSRTG